MTTSMLTHFSLAAALYMITAIFDGCYFPQFWWWYWYFIWDTCEQV